MRLFINAIVFLFSMVGVSQALVITEPKNGDLFHVGDTVRVVAELSADDPDIGYVDFFFTKDGGECPNRKIATHPRYECSFNIPSGSPHAVKIWVLGKTIEGAISSPKITILEAVPSTGTIQGIKVFTGNTSNKLFFFQIGQHRRLHVDGIYSDGVKREELSSGAAVTTYTSTDEKVVTVDPDGSVTAQGFGTARITIKNGKHQ